MKANKYIAGLLALFTAQAASAATFEVTGATAFRRATIESIHALYVANGGAFKFGHNKSAATDYINADFITFDGTITGLGATTIRCSFNGSIEGLRALAQPGQTGIDGSDGDASYIKLSSVTATPIVGGANQYISGIDVTNPNLSTHIDRAVAEMAFSDTDKSISPYAGTAMVGTSPGVLVFALVNSEGGGITNVTTQQYNSLLANGVVEKAMFTGLTGDETKLVFCTGRNDGSGTRSSYLSEMGYGVANPVTQYLVVGEEGNQITAIQAVPAGGTNDTDNDNTNGVQLDPGTDIANFDAKPGTGTFDQVTQLFTSKSTVWGQDNPGNGGAFSGSVLRGHLALDGDSVTVFDADGYDIYGTPRADISLISWISLNDAITARSNGATLCSFNGVKLDVTGNVLTTLDKKKIYNGNYTAWNFQKFYRLTSASSDTITLFNSIASSVANGNLGVAGLKNVDMLVGRANDGGVINPIF